MKKAIPIAAGVILSADQRQVFIAQRASKADQGALWEFPGGKVELGENAEQALARELEEEIGIQVTELEHFIALNHQYGDKLLSFDFFLVHQFTGKAYGKEMQPTQWVDIEKLANFAFPEANLPVLEAVLLRFSTCKLPL